MEALDRIEVLLVRAGGRLYALPIAHVVEVIRGLPVERIAGAPPHVSGLAVVRGSSVPVVDLGLLAGDRSAAGRFVSLRVGDRRVALAVDAVLGVRAFDGWLLQELPPLLRDACADLIATIGVLDGELLVALRAGRLVPDDIWRALASEAAS
jgi:purine-binding chemotaxis protein CheW